VYKNPDTGFYEADFRRKGIRRLHVSYGVKRKEDAAPLDAAMRRVVREKRTALIDKVRSGDIDVHQIAACIADERPLSSLMTETIEAADWPWPSVWAAADSYIKWLAKSDKRAKGTAVSARTQINRFIEFVGAGALVDQIPSSTIVAFQAHLYSQEYAQNTIVGTMWRVSGLFTWLQRQEQKRARDEKRVARSLASPVDAEEVTSRKTKRERCLTEPEGERLLAATPTPFLAAVMLGLFSGLRIDEMRHLRPRQDVDLKLGLLTIQEQPEWHPKNRKRRAVPIAPQLRPVLEYHIAHYASEHWLFPSSVVDDQPIGRSYFFENFARLVANAEMVAGRDTPEGVVYHTLRHTFASWLVMKGVDLYTVSKLLGNTLKMVEDTYAHLAPDFRQRAVDKLAGIIEIPQLQQNPPQTTGAEGEGAT